MPIPLESWMPLDDLDLTLLARYFNGEGSEADVQAVRRWIAADPARAVVIDRLRNVWRIAGEAHPTWDTEGALATVRRRAARASESTRAHKPALELLRPSPTPVYWRV